VHQPSLVERLVDLKFDYTDFEHPRPRGPGVKYTMGRQLYDNEHTSDCVFLAAGALINATNAVWSGSVDSAFANIRPPGHHASYDKIGGFCYINNVAIAAAHARHNLGARKIAIFDWDVHHGNGTQDIFKSDPDTLFISAHRYDDAKFYPYLKDSAADFIGQGEGRGFNINLAWNTERPGEVSAIADGDYKRAFEGVVWPALERFRPELVLVSAGFDAMMDDSVGKLSLTPDIFAYMTYRLQKEFKTVLALEGGYNLETMQSASYACIRALLRKEIDFENYQPRASELGVENVMNTVRNVGDYWELERYNVLGGDY
jgi:acetoin utilization deacetylase AcuC-like enzyme